MRISPSIALCGLLLLAVLIGCKKEEEKKTSKTSTTAAKEEHHHGHSEADKLVWQKKDVEHEGYKISLGHHGDHFHGGDKIEPAAIITKDGNPVENVTLLVQLMDEEGKNPVTESCQMVFEPKTEKEPAHFAQAQLEFPKEEKTYMISFRVSLPDGENEYREMIPVKIGH